MRRIELFPIDFPPHFRMDILFCVVTIELIELFKKRRTSWTHSDFYFFNLCILY